MKTRVFTLIATAAAATSLGIGAASAEEVCTVAGCATVNEGGYLVVADGDAGNPDPADGFLSVSSGGKVCSDDNGSADDGDPDNGPESASPECRP